MDAADELAFKHLLKRLLPEEIPEPICIAGGELRVGDIMAWHGEVLEVLPHPEWDSYIVAHVVRRGIEAWVPYPRPKQCPVVEIEPNDPRHRGGPRDKIG